MWLLTYYTADCIDAIIFQSFDLGRVEWDRDSYNPGTPYDFIMILIPGSVIVWISLYSAYGYASRDYLLIPPYTLLKLRSEKPCNTIVCSASGIYPTQPKYQYLQISWKHLSRHKQIEWFLNSKLWLMTMFWVFRDLTASVCQVTEVYTETIGLVTTSRMNLVAKTSTVYRFVLQ